MISATSFRRAAPADRALLERLCRDYRLADHQPLAPERVAAALQAALAGDPTICIWMIEMEGACVGYLALTIGFSIEAGGRDAFVDELLVEEGWRGRGIGTRAIEFALQECARLGVCRLNLEVERGNPDARRLYLRAGFVDHERHLMSRWVQPPR